MYNIGFIYLPTDIWPDCPHLLSAVSNAAFYTYVIVCEWPGRDSLLNLTENSRKGQGRWPGGFNNRKCDYTKFTEIGSTGEEQLWQER